MEKTTFLRSHGQWILKGPIATSLEVATYTVVGDIVVTAALRKAIVTIVRPAEPSLTGDRNRSGSGRRSDDSQSRYEPDRIQLHSVRRIEKEVIVRGENDQERAVEVN